MNIGIDIRALLTVPRTGIGEYTFELLDAIFKQDKKNNYYLFYNSYHDVLDRLPIWQQPNVHFIGTNYPNKLFNTSIKFFHYPKLDQLTIRHLDYFFSPNLGFTALSHQTKHILTIHDLSFEFFPEYYTARKRLWHRLVNPKKQCKNAHLILTPSENTKRDIADYYKIDPQKIKVLYPGLSTSFDIRHSTCNIKSKYFLPENFILFLGTIEPRKNILAIITAFEQARRFLPTQYTLVIAGSSGWNNKFIYNRAAGSPYKDYIKFLGYIDEKDKPALYAAASLFVYPSFYEGFGFPVLEALASGVPVITTNRSSLPEVAGSSAYFINPHKPDEIITGIKTILGDRLLRQNMIQKGRLEAAQFTWEQTAAQWLNLLEKYFLD